MWLTRRLVDRDDWSKGLKPSYLTKQIYTRKAQCNSHLISYLEISSSYWFPSEELASDIIHSSKQLNVSVLSDKQNFYYTQQSTSVILLLGVDASLLFTATTSR